MPIYKILIVNKKNICYLWDFENFENEDEIFKYKTENEIDGDRIAICEKAESLADILSDLKMDGTDNLLNNFKMIHEKFGMELLKVQFSSELVNLNLLFASALEMWEKKYDALQQAYWDSLESEDKFGYESDSNPEIEAAEDEMRRWDDEDPSWRIANDFD